MKIKDIGPTGDFPEGKLDSTDEGALDIAVSRYKDTVRIDFGKSVTWIAMGPALAKEVAHSIMRQACLIEFDE
jgi:hypothetical protein